MRRTGFTLLEMILVMMVVTIAASIAIPVVDSMLHPNQVKASIDVVRAHWEQARSRALEEGRPYRFSIRENGGAFCIEPDDADTNQEEGYKIDGQLPETCLFVDQGTGVIDAGAKPSEGGAWKVVAVFLPDGTARDDALLSFGRAGLARATLKLRALTGQVTQVREKTP